MRRLPSLALSFVAVICLTGPGGCGGQGVNVHLASTSVEKIVASVIEWVEDETGIELKKEDVTIESLGARKDSSGQAHISDFKITVNYRQTAFTTTPKDIPCSNDGVPTAEGNRRIKEAVQEIKGHIRAVK